MEYISRGSVALISLRRFFLHNYFIGVMMKKCIRFVAIALMVGIAFLAQGVISSFRHFVREGEKYSIMELMMKRYYVLVCCLICFAGCKKDVPQAPLEIITGKRDYVWTRDTIQYPGNAQTAMQSMYASSDSNVYLVGHCEVSRGRMWRYDGADWRAVDVSNVRGGIEAIDGCGPNDIWIVGGQAFFSPDSSYLIDSTLVAHFDGTTWQQVAVLPRRGGLRCLDVYSTSVIFAGGQRGLLCKKDGNQWTVYEVGQQYYFSSIAALSPTETFAIGHVNDHALPVDSSGSFLFRFNGTEWKKIDSVMQTANAPAPHMGIAVYSSGSTLYSVGPNVYRRTGLSWSSLVQAEVGHLSQSSDNNIVAVGRAVWHFNGVNWQEFSHLYPVFGYDCYTDGKEIFIVGNDGSKTYVLHAQ